MRKRIISGSIFVLGVAFGLLLMANFCDELFGGWLARSRTKVAFPNYSVKVTGGIITKSRPGRIHIRAVDLNMQVSLQKSGNLLGDPLMMVLDNLPEDFRVIYEGSITGIRSKGQTSLVLDFPSVRKPFKTRISIVPPSPMGSFTFWVAGDSRSRLKPLKTLLKKARLKKPLCIVLGGDLVAHGFSWQYKRLMETLDETPAPVFAVPGNHDLEFCGRRNFTRYLAPDHYYFTYGKSLFAVLDTNQGNKGQLQWLDEILGNPFYVHRFVFVHKPPFDPRQGENHCMHKKDFAQGLLEVLSKHRVDILFCSHIHSYIQTEYKGIKIIITGGLGAHRKRPIKPFHYVEVEVDGQKVKANMLSLEH
jgi:Icc-related predicted phosphoesterase